MKTNTLSALILSLGFLFGLSNCSSPATLSENAITFDSLKIERTAHLFNDTTKPACHLTIDLIYPLAYADSNILDSLQRLFLTATMGEKYDLPIADAVQFYCDYRISRYKEPEKEYRKDVGISVYTYEEFIQTTLVFNKGNILSFMAYNWFYTGGAHGLGAATGNIIDVEKGKLLTKSDIFKDNTEEALSELIIKKLMVNYNVLTLDSLRTVGFFEPSEIKANENLLANDTGITFIYNPYEIAAYAVSQVNVLLPYTEIANYMREDSPLYKFTK